MHLKIFCLNLLFSFSAFSFDQTLNKFIPESSYYKIQNEDFSKSLKNYQYVEVNVENTGDAEKELYFGVKDDKTHDYWSQLTYKTMLTKGINRLVIDLNRSVGERGSSTSKRKINKSNVQEVFIVFNPEKKTTQEIIKLKKIRLFNTTEPKPLRSGKYFIFGNLEEKEYKFAENITKNSLYKKNISSGFESLDLWQERDAKIAPKALSVSLSIHQAIFSTDLSAGEYNVDLVWDELGYWEVPFWKERRVLINGSPLLIETRATWADFLTDLYLFKNTALIHPFNQLIDHIFKVKSFQVKHAGGKFSLQFEGDPSGASLNTLAIFKANDLAATRFKESVVQYYKQEFDLKYREYKPKETKKEQDIFITSFSGKHIYDSCDKITKKTAFLVKDSTRVRICVQGLSGKKLKIKNSGKHELQAYRIAKQYRSLDLNHESYSVGPSHLEPVSSLVEIESDFEVLELVFKKISKKETFLSLSISAADVERNFKVPLKRLKYVQPEMPIKLGFFGASPLPFTYFKDSEKESFQKGIKLKVADKLLNENIKFTTDFLSLDFNYNSQYSQFGLSFDLELLKKSGEALYFYDSKQLKDILSGNPRNVSQGEDDYFLNLNSEFNQLMSRTQQDFIYLYSDEASGYRNAIDEDLVTLKKIKKLLPGALLGGFGNLYDFKKAQKLYEAWDVGFYTDIPENDYIQKLDSLHRKWGLYNICAEVTAPMRICYGVALYKLFKSGVQEVLEWHLNSSQNYPYFDIDGREADIAFLVSDQTGALYETYRYSELQHGLIVFWQLLSLDSYLASRKTFGLTDKKAKDWLFSVNKLQTFPIKSLIKKLNASGMSNFYTSLNQFSEELLSEFR